MHKLRALEQDLSCIGTLQMLLRTGGGPTGVLCYKRLFIFYGLAADHQEYCFTIFLLFF